MRACKELGYKELPCKILAPDTPVKKLREYATKDNVNFGENDLDVMENEWNKAELQDWGIEFAPRKSYKTGKISKSNVIDIKDVRHALQNSNTKS
mgnify:CR=1 FL=1